MTILIPALILGTLGLLFGAGLAIASKALAVSENERAGALRELLPGANCGGCGYPGCDGYAHALADGLTQNCACCPVGGQALADKLASELGLERAVIVPRVATVLCRGTGERCRVNFDYVGLDNCVSAMQVLGGPKACSWACLGRGTCQAVCEFGAIIMENGIARIDEAKCTACGRCVSACPKNVLELRPRGTPVTLRCRAAERGKAVMQNCNAGCIGCGKCSRLCKFGAITMVNDLPILDAAKCIGCLQCAKGCPTGALVAREHTQRVALIDASRCTACGKCKTACHFEALSDDDKPAVYPEACTGCRQCVQACPEKCIVLVKAPMSEA